MNIEIGKGLSNIIFGMTEDEIIQLLDQPDRILTCRDDGREYLYNALKLKLFFGFEESDRLYSIEVFRKDLTFLSTRVIGLSLEDLLSFMQQSFLMRVTLLLPLNSMKSHHLSFLRYFIWTKLFGRMKTNNTAPFFLLHQRKELLNTR